MQTAYIVAGLGFGDEGKGATVDYLVRQHKAGLVVRYNGGPQAAHNVVTPDGRHHTFAQFGSGSLVPGVKTFLSRFMLVKPPNMMREQKALSQNCGVLDAGSRTYVEDTAVVVTGFHALVNQLLEQGRRSGAHGTCGIGVGEARRDSLLYPDKVLRVGDLRDEALCIDKLQFLWQVAEDKLRQAEIDYKPLKLLNNPDGLRALWREHYREWVDWVEIVDKDWLPERLGKAGNVVFEGAQGVLLDEKYGFAPHNTWTNTTFDNAASLLWEADYVARGGEVRRIGVLRTYHTRHGAGPFPTEDSLGLPEPHNLDGGHQGPFRQGHFDGVLARYAVDVCRGGIDELYLTHGDRCSEGTKVCVAYEGFEPTSKNRELVEKGWTTDHTELLSNSRPTYCNIKEREAFFRFVASAVRAPIGNVAYGSSWTDRETIKPSIGARSSVGAEQGISTP